MSSERSFRRPTRRAAVAATCVAGALLLSACGVSGGAGAGVRSDVLPKLASASTVREAGQRTAAVTTASVAVTVKVTDGSGKTTATITSEGAYDASAQQGRFTVGSDGKVAGIDASQLTADLVVDHGDVYVRAPALKVFTDKPWLKLSADTFGPLADKLGQVTTLHPESILDALEGVSSKVDQVGTDQVRGVATTHLRVHLDIDKALAKLPAQKRTRLEDALAKVTGLHDELRDVPADVWIDSDGYVRRLQLSNKLPKLEGTSGRGTTTETVELYGFDAPVRVEVPPAGQVATFDLSSLFGN